jgi:diadenosine tetraphosphate (Ap4A) HIT family hydrolase
MAESVIDCELCSGPGGETVFEDGLCRVVRVADPDYPGFCRVIWHAHVAEMTDLPATERRHLMAVVFAVETALRGLCRADKINLASFGNMVPHLHWHVIPRFRGDRHFPQPVFAAPQRPASAQARPMPTIAALRDAIVRTLAEEQGGGS